MQVNHYTIPIFVPELGCPFQCIFCNQRKITNGKKIPDAEEVRCLIEEYLASFPGGKHHIEIGFFGGNFTGLPMDEQESYLRVAHSFLESGKVHGIRLSTRPDYISEQGLHPLKQYGVSTIELGAQSMDEEVLIQSARGHTAGDVEMASQMIVAHGFRLGLQMMVGLPGDTLEKSLFTARRIIELGANETRIYPVLVIKGTTLAEWYEKGKYKPLSLDEAVRWVKQLLPLFEEAGVGVTRVGLHGATRLLRGEELLAGPCHESFRELAMTGVWWDRLSYLLQVKDKNSLLLTVHPSQYNFAVGYYGENRKRLQKHFGEVRFGKDIKLKANEFRVEYY